MWGLDLSLVDAATEWRECGWLEIGVASPGVPLLLSTHNSSPFVLCYLVQTCSTHCLFVWWCHWAWSTHLAAGLISSVALIPIFICLVLLIPACRCLGLWWQLLKTDRAREPGFALFFFFFIDLPPDSTTHLLLSRKNNSQESCLPLVPVQVFNSVLIVLREGNIRKPL